MDLLQYSITVGGNGQWGSFNTLPHCWGAVGSGSPSVHCHTAGEQWAMNLLLYSATPVQSGGQWDSFRTPPHCWGSPATLPHHRGAAGRESPAVHRHTAREQWAVGILQDTVTLLGGSGQWNSSRSGSPSAHCHTAREHGAEELVLYIAALLGSNGSWNSLCKQPHYCGVLGSATPSLHYYTPMEQWAMGLLVYVATLPRAMGNGCASVHYDTASGKWTSFGTLLHC